MKAELRDGGYIEISAESIAEAFALRHIMPRVDGDSCGNCGRQDVPIIINTNTPQEREERR